MVFNIPRKVEGSRLEGVVVASKENKSHAVRRSERRQALGKRRVVPEDKYKKVNRGGKKVAPTKTSSVTGSKDVASTKSVLKAEYADKEAARNEIRPLLRKSIAAFGRQNGWKQSEVDMALAYSESLLYTGVSTPEPDSNLRDKVIEVFARQCKYRERVVRIDLLPGTKFPGFLTAYQSQARA